MPASDEEFYRKALRRITLLMLVLAVGGGTLLAVFEGVRIGLGFLVGGGVSYLSFWRWEQVAAALAPGARPRSAWSLVFRLLLLMGLAYGIIRLLGLNLAAALAGLLVAAGAVILEILYELIYAGT